MISIYLSLLLSSTLTQASVPKQEILGEFASRIQEWQKPNQWQQFIQSHTQLFPALSEAKPTYTEVTKEELKINNETFTLAICYNSALIKIDINQVKKMFTEPDKFQAIYDLSEPVAIPGGTVDDFQGHIYKKVTGFKDQNYTLRYQASVVGDLWCQRASMVEDKGEFALRDNFKCLEKSGDSTIYREVSFLYPLDWYVRALGPQVRTRFQQEMNWLAKVVKCISEELSGKEWDSKVAPQCWKKIRS